MFIIYYKGISIIFAITHPGSKQVTGAVLHTPYFSVGEV
jgi:hypothetical protein